MTPAESRQELGLTQSQLARLMGNTSAMTVSKWETGKRHQTAQAAELLRLLLWLHEEYPRIYAQWVGNQQTPAGD
ncbi:hypothetical protein DJ031_04555 [bacterium endosymbiont of Escarpia laminata]|nr:MAG: hypothetical protein DJ031_04555 [bacterium endosymbiont of Escarpia laminata]